MTPVTLVALAVPLLAGTVALAACTGSDQILSPGSYTRHSTEIDGVQRTWNVYTPEAAPSGDAPMPVVLVVHGTGGTGDGMRSGIGPDLEREAEEQGFIVAYVDGYDNNWNECRVAGDWAAKQEDLDDVGLMRHIVDSETGGTGGTAGTAGIAPAFAIGYSSGGHMVQRLAYEAPDLVDSIAVVNANVPVDDNNSCTDAGDPVPAMFLEGRADPVNPFTGGEVVVGSGSSAESRGDVRSAVDSAEWFAERNGIPAGSSSATVRDGDAEVTTWHGDAPVRLVAVDRSEHSFPTATGRWRNNGGARYDGPGAIWEFFDGLQTGHLSRPSGR